jgi:hypothetical protein
VYHSARFSWLHYVLPAEIKMVKFIGVERTHCVFWFERTRCTAYKGVSRSFQTHNEININNNNNNKQTNKQTLIEKHHKGLWWQNSLD